ncbi:MAG: phosphate acyltransferase PlsX [Armatimonadetes bacterium]|nr:phosphate acyltransferase PlsX [Armatimonadota bacterium]
MKIAVDAMGGDHAPAVVVAGAVAASRELGTQIVLVGPEARVRAELVRHRADGSGIEIADAPEVIEMHESPAMALRRKRRASISVAVELIRDGRADAVVSAGHTGAAMGAALLGLGRISGVDRPAIAAVLPTLATTPVILLDVGANVDCRPHHLQQFALMGSVYANRVLGIAAPRIGVLSNGSEEGKGNDLTNATSQLLRASPGLQFVGNVEARDIFSAVADVVVCDGFVGNVILKTCEGLGAAIAKDLGQRLAAHLPVEVATSIAREVFSRVSVMDNAGGPILGVNGVVIVGHGRARSPMVRAAIQTAAFVQQRGLVEAIRRELAAIHGDRSAG